MLGFEGLDERRRRPGQPEGSDHLSRAVDAGIVRPAEGCHARGLGDPWADRLEALDSGQPGVGIGMVDGHLEDDRDRVGRPDAGERLEEKGPHLGHPFAGQSRAEGRHSSRIDDLSELLGGRRRRGGVIEPATQLLQPRAPLLLRDRLPLRPLDELDLLAGPPGAAIADEPPLRHEHLL